MVLFLAGLWFGPRLETYMRALEWAVALTFVPDGRIFCAERLTGRIRINENGTKSSGG